MVKEKKLKRLYFTATASDLKLVEEVAKSEKINSEAKATAMVFAKGKESYKKLLK